MRIIYVAGWMRSGTTLLGEVLGSSREVLAVGELSGIWGAAARDERCSCGSRLSACDVWTPALERASERTGISPQDYASVSVLAQRVLRTRRLLTLFRLRGAPMESWPPDVRRYAAITSVLIEELGAVAGVDVIIDTSKLPPSLLLYRALSEVTTDVVHIYRDPRGVAHSERKTYGAVSDDDSQPIPPGQTLVGSALLWSAMNCVCLVVEFFDQGAVLVRYEDLASRPVRVSDRLRDVLGLVAGDGGGTGQGHLAVGNPARFGGHARPVTRDDAWRVGLSPFDKLVVVTMTLPVRLTLSLAGLSQRFRPV